MKYFRFLKNYVLCVHPQPLLLRKQEHEKKRKEIKEQWLKAKRKLVTFTFIHLFSYQNTLKLKPGCVYKQRTVQDISSTGI